MTFIHVVSEVQFPYRVGLNILQLSERDACPSQIGLAVVHKIDSAAALFYFLWKRADDAVRVA